MGKFTGVLLASDFDNTLIYTEEALRKGEAVPPLSQKNRAALEYFMAEGGKFAIATGRALVAIARHAADLPMNAPAVVCNGAALYDFEKKEYLEIEMLDGAALRRGQQVLDRFPEVAVEAYHIDNVIYAVQANEFVRQHERITEVQAQERASLEEVPLPLGKLLFEGEHEALQQARDYMAEQDWAAEYELIFSTRNLLELTARGADKGGMVRRLARHLGISMEHVYCAGDEANDLSMLRCAAEGFAPENCIPAVRESGATIVSHAREDAVADIIALLDEKYSRQPSAEN